MIYSDLCDIQRRSTTSQAYGSKPNYTAHLINVPCRLVQKSQRGFNSITAEWIVGTDYQLLVPSNTDALEGDRVTNVRLKDGTVYADSFQIDGGAIPRRGRMHRHKALRLRKVS